MPTPHPPVQRGKSCEQWHSAGNPNSSRGTESAPQSQIPAREASKAWGEGGGAQMSSPLQAMSPPKPGACSLLTTHQARRPKGLRDQGLMGKAFHQAETVPATPPELCRAWQLLSRWMLLILAWGRNTTGRASPSN